jgi:hypothetical protein
MRAIASSLLPQVLKTVSEPFGKLDPSQCLFYNGRGESIQASVVIQLSSRFLASARAFFSDAVGTKVFADFSFLCHAINFSYSSRGTAIRSEQSVSSRGMVTVIMVSIYHKRKQAVPIAGLWNCVELRVGKYNGKHRYAAGYAPPGIRGTPRPTAVRKGN